jgi:hypothetical protein
MPLAKKATKIVYGSHQNETKIFTLKIFAYLYKINLRTYIHNSHCGLQSVVQYVDTIISY